mmetsp:Transcript_63169/g.150621  ORF Transcript_63169/g.150621 Transcript_63169/m.150621 type:complete len:163 (-) Transcript_63169:42-530(-)
MPFEVCVKARNGQLTVLDVDDSLTVGALKGKLQDFSGKAPAAQPKLYFNGVELGDTDKTLKDYGIVPDDCPGGPILTLGLSKADPFDVYVQLPSGGQHKAWVTCSTTVAQLKSLISEGVGIPYLMIQLLHNYKELKDGKTLGELGVLPDAKLMLRSPKSAKG